MQKYVKNNTHVCLVANTSWSMIKFRKNLITYLLQNDFKVSVIAPMDEYSAQITDLGANFIELKMLSGKGKNPLNDIKLVREFKSIYRQLKPDILFQYTIKPNVYSTIAARELKIPVIAVITGLGYTFINNGIVPFIAKKLYQQALKTATEVWFLNNDDRNLFINKKLVNKSKTAILNGEGIDTEWFKPTPLNVQNSKIKFILIARLLWDKGIREFYEAATIIKAKYPNTEFSFLGYLNVENPKALSEAQMEQWVATGHINYLGSSSDVRPIIQAHDCVVLPSYREGISVTLMEGAALAKPLIASDIAGCKELIEENKNGFLCQVRDVESLAVCFEKLIQLPLDKRLEMGNNSRQKMVNEFSFESIVPKYKEAILKYCGK
jgi:glycosyltransferase involved in cell wall biosynthesis